MSTVVKLERFFPLTPKRLFDYFMSRHELQRWFYPTEMVVEFIEFSAHEGGRYINQFVG
jgi:uncharacterized protein YndB with AHSA1/START domain